jgi:hypothetical protein
MESPSSHQPPLSARLFLSLITCYSVRQQLFDNLTPYSVACLLHIFKVQLGNEVGTVEKQRFLNPIRCLFDNSEMEEIEERIKKGHAIILWGKDLELMTQLLQNPEPRTHKGWPQRLNLGISDFVLAGSCSGKKTGLPGHWQPSPLEDGRKTFIKFTTPEPGIWLHDMYFATRRTWTGVRSTIWTLSYDWDEHDQGKFEGMFIHPQFPRPVYRQVDHSIAYINVHESSNIVKGVQSPLLIVDHLHVTLSYLNFEVEGLDTASTTLEDTLEMRRAWLEGKEAYLQIDW